MLPANIFHYSHGLSLKWRRNITVSLLILDYPYSRWKNIVEKVCMQNRSFLYRIPEPLDMPDILLGFCQIHGALPRPNPILKKVYLSVFEAHLFHCGLSRIAHMGHKKTHKNLQTKTSRPRFVFYLHKQTSKFGSIDQGFQAPPTQH